MNVITAPTVELISRQELLSGNLERWLEANSLTWDRDYSDGSPGEVIAEASGRVCYLSYGKPRPGGNAAYLAHIKEVGHGSVFEHVAWTFMLSGVSRSLTHELVRHRVGVAYSQLSQRFVDESTADFVCPDIIHGDAALMEFWRVAVCTSHRVYAEISHGINQRLLTEPGYADRWLPNTATTTDRRKLARQAARSVLPNATETKLAFTANARALRHIFDMRAKFEAEPEIRKLAHRLWGVVVRDSPHLFGDYTEVTLPDGTTALTTDYPGV